MYSHFVLNLISLSVFTYCLWKARIAFLWQDSLKTIFFCGYKVMMCGSFQISLQTKPGNYSMRCCQGDPLVWITSATDRRSMAVEWQHESPIDWRFVSPDRAPIMRRSRPSWVHVAWGWMLPSSSSAHSGRDVVEEFLARITSPSFQGRNTKCAGSDWWHTPSVVDDDRSPYVTIRPRQQHVVLF